MKPTRHWKKYVASKTEVHVRAYNRFVDLYFDLYQASCDYVKTYADIAYKQAVAGLFKEIHGDLQNLECDVEN